MTCLRWPSPSNNAPLPQISATSPETLLLEDQLRRVRVMSVSELRPPSVDLLAVHADGWRSSDSEPHLITVNGDDGDPDGPADDDLFTNPARKNQHRVLS